MKSYIGQQFRIASPTHKGLVEDHYELVPFVASDPDDPETIIIPGFFTLYFQGGFYNHIWSCDKNDPIPEPQPDFDLDDIYGLSSHPRNYTTLGLERAKISLEEGILTAIEMAKRRNLIACLKIEHQDTTSDLTLDWLNEWWSRELIWHPEGWEPYEA